MGINTKVLSDIKYTRYEKIMREKFENIFRKCRNNELMILWHLEQFQKQKYNEKYAD